MQYVGRPALWPPWPCAAAESPAGGYGIRPYGAGVMLVIPDKSLKQKIPEQTFEDFVST